MFEPTRAALKEWAIVCQALADGRQLLLIRKGGIEEVKEGFQVTHRDFWLFPTYVHQKPADLIPPVHAEFERAQAAQPPAGTLPLQLYAPVSGAVKVISGLWTGSIFSRGRPWPRGSTTAIGPASTC